MQCRPSKHPRNNNMRTCGILCHQGHQAPKKGKQVPYQNRKQRCDDVCLVVAQLCYSFCSSYPLENAPFSQRFNQPHQRFTPHSAEMENRSALRSVQRVPTAAREFSRFFPFNAIHPTHNKVISSFQRSLPSKVLLFNISHVWKAGSIIIFWLTFFGNPAISWRGNHR